ncbi:hypothetical protein MUU49_11655 [Scandinavium goeteborgense]|uniref:hypothetical protein n=1 Tax=Scandinavium goeteborgense TaxID=1851514 RepID=UPI0021669763|nr:hypothetical protein [Scandinavium goeteborgense]MCS2153220.1 hypothetical protein [Scandinavium goeteborgense]
MTSNNTLLHRIDSAGRSLLYALSGAALLTISVSAFASNDDDDVVQVDSQPAYLMNNPDMPVWQLTITSLDNDIVIQSFTLNRGNCLISYPGRGQNVNKRLGYSQTLTFTTPSNDGFTKCKPLEFTVQTSKGEFTYNW